MNCRNLTSPADSRIIKALRFSAVRQDRVLVLRSGPRSQCRQHAPTPPAVLNAIPKALKIMTRFSEVA